MCPGFLVIYTEQYCKILEVQSCSIPIFACDGKFSIDNNVCCCFLQDFLGKSDPYLEILKGNSDGSWSVIHRTEVIF